MNPTMASLLEAIERWEATLAQPESSCPGPPIPLQGRRSKLCHGCIDHLVICEVVCLLEVDSLVFFATSLLVSQAQLVMPDAGASDQ